MIKFIVNAFKKDWEAKKLLIKNWKSINPVRVVVVIIIMCIIAPIQIHYIHVRKAEYQNSQEYKDAAKYYTPNSK